MAILAIRGHKTRGKEVIEILEMLGGKNKTDSDGLKWFNGTNVDSYYTIEGDNYIHMRLDSRKGDYIKFTLEEFLEKFPYKVGDKVNVCGENAALVIGMRWESDYVLYRVRMEKNGYETSKIVEELQPYTEQKEESMEMNIVNNDCDFKINTITELCDIKVITFANCNLNEVEIDLADKFEIVLKDGKYYAVRKQPQYPKTYEECCKLLNKATFISFEGLSLGEVERYKPYIKLCRCRDAYWKLAGDWKPLDAEEGKTFCIYYNRFLDELEKASGIFDANAILDFPTEEMRDNFFENFKELIEECKELL